MALPDLSAWQLPVTAPSDPWVDVQVTTPASDDVNSCQGCRGDGGVVKRSVSPTRMQRDSPTWPGSTVTSGVPVRQEPVSDVPVDTGPDVPGGVTAEAGGADPPESAPAVFGVAVAHPVRTPSATMASVDRAARRNIATPSAAIISVGRARVTVRSRWFTEIDTALTMRERR
jgi:hypothetical protein